MPFRISKNLINIIIPCAIEPITIPAKTKVVMPLSLDILVRARAINTAAIPPRNANIAIENLLPAKRNSNSSSKLAPDETPIRSG